MFLPTKSYWLAVHHIFSETQIEAGESMSLGELMASWGQLGLRQNDLASALDSLSRTGHVRLEMRDDGPRVMLLSEGFGLLSPDGRDTAAVQALEHLRQMRRRPAHIRNLLGTPVDNRRSGDREARVR